MRKLVGLLLPLLCLLPLSNFAQPWLWADAALGGGEDQPWDLVTYKEKAIVTGRMQGTLQLGSNLLSSAGGNDIFLTQLDQFGNVLWAVSAGGSGEDLAQGVDVDGDGNIYIAGTVSGTANFSGTTVTTHGPTASYVASYDSAGNFRWVRMGNASSSSVGGDVIVGTNGDLYTTGSFEGSWNVAGNTLTSTGLSDLFLLKYDLSGNELWGLSGAGPLNDRGIELCMHLDGDVALASWYEQSITFAGNTQNSSGPATLVARVHPDGTLLWARSLSTAIEERCGMDSDGCNNTYLHGSFQGSLSIGQSTSFTASDPLDFDGFMSRFDTLGLLEFALQIGGSSGSQLICEADVDYYGNSYITGSFQNEINFDANTTATGNGFFEFFMAKYNYGAAYRLHETGNTPSGSSSKGFGIGISTLRDIYTTGDFMDQLQLGSFVLQDSGQNDRDPFVALYDHQGQCGVVYNYTYCQGLNLVLDAYHSAAISYQWNGGATTSSITVNSPGRYTVTVTLNDCISYANNYIVTPFQIVGELWPPDTTLCDGDSLLLDAGAGFDSYSWASGETTQTITVTQAGFYEVTVTDSCGTFFSDIRVFYNDGPQVPLGPDQDFCGRDTMTIGQFQAGVQYLWSTGESSPTIEIDQAGTYWLRAWNECGEYNDTINIGVDFADGFYIPNVFTPNNDGVNDGFQVEARNPERYEVSLYDRWGRELWYNRDPNSSWYGRFNETDVPEGIYFCIFRGLNCKEEFVKEVKAVTLVR